MTKTANRSLQFTHTCLLVMASVMLIGCMPAGTLSMDAKQYENIVDASNQMMFDWYHAEEYRSSGDIPYMYYRDAHKAMDPVRMYEDKLNLVIVLEETANIESGLYVRIPASDYDPTTEADRFIKFDPVESRSLGDVMGSVYLYTLAR